MHFFTMCTAAVHFFLLVLLHCLLVTFCFRVSSLGFVTLELLRVLMFANSMIFIGSRQQTGVCGSLKSHQFATARDFLVV